MKSLRPWSDILDGSLFWKVSEVCFGRFEVCFERLRYIYKDFAVDGLRILRAKRKALI